ANAESHAGQSGHAAAGRTDSTADRAAGHSATNATNPAGCRTFSGDFTDSDPAVDAGTARAQFSASAAAGRPAPARPDPHGHIEQQHVDPVAQRCDSQSVTE